LRYFHYHNISLPGRRRSQPPAAPFTPAAAASRASQRYAAV